MVNTPMNNGGYEGPSDFSPIARREAAENSIVKTNEDGSPIKWPGWRYGPDGQSQIFNSADEVPDGWVDNPNDLPDSKTPSPKVKARAKAAEAYATWDTAQLKAELAVRKIEFQDGWPDDKLRSLLAADDVAKAGK